MDHGEISRAFEEAARRAGAALEQFRRHLERQRAYRTVEIRFQPGTVYQHDPSLGDLQIVPDVNDPPLLHSASQAAYERTCWKPSRYGEAYECFVDGTMRGHVWLHREHRLYPQGIYEWTAESVEGEWSNAYTADFAEAMRNVQGFAASWVERTRA